MGLGLSKGMNILTWLYPWGTFGGILNLGNRTPERGQRERPQQLESVEGVRDNNGAMKTFTSRRHLQSCPGVISLGHWSISLWGV